MKKKIYIYSRSSLPRCCWCCYPLVLLLPLLRVTRFNNATSAFSFRLIYSFAFNLILPFEQFIFYSLRSVLCVVFFLSRRLLLQHSHTLLGAHNNNNKKMNSRI